MQARDVGYSRLAYPQDGFRHADRAAPSSGAAKPQRGGPCDRHVAAGFDKRDGKGGQQPVAADRIGQAADAAGAQRTPRLFGSLRREPRAADDGHDRIDAGIRGEYANDPKPGLGDGIAN